VYDDFTWPVTMRGHDDVRRFLRVAWRAFPDMRFELVEGPYLRGEDKAAFWWRGEGTFTGPLDPPGFAPTGKPWRLDGVDFHEYRDGLISRLVIIFDMAEGSQQVGLLPAPGGRAERVAVGLQRLAMRVRRG
jgi:SnoaL-like domain